MEAYERFEHEWARFNGSDPAGMVACSSGTAALHLALEALQLPPASEVIVPDYTMVACPRAVALAGLTPVFVDCGDDLLIDTGLLGEAFRPMDQFPVVMAVHVYGRRCDMDRVVREMVFTDMPLIEDLAEAHGVRPHPVTDAACWSFYKNKIIAGEEGGAVAFRDPAAAARARELRSLGFTAAHDFYHRPRGHNYRMANALAEKVLGSLSRYDDFDTWAPYRRHDGIRNQRRNIEGRWDAACPPEWRMPKRDAPWVYDLRVRGMTAEGQRGAVSELNGMGVAARHGFKPMHAQEEFSGCRLITAGGRSRAEELSTEVIYLPLTPTTAETVRRTYEVIRRHLA